MSVLCIRSASTTGQSIGTSGPMAAGGWLIVDRPRDVLAPAAWRTDDQHARAGRDGQADLLADAADRVAFADELADVESPSHFAPQALQERVQLLRRDLAIRSKRCWRFRREQADQQQPRLIVAGGKPDESRRPLFMRPVLAGRPGDVPRLAFAREGFGRRAERGTNVGRGLLRCRRRDSRIAGPPGCRPPVRATRRAPRSQKSLAFGHPGHTAAAPHLPAAAPMREREREGGPWRYFSTLSSMLRYSTPLPWFCRPI